jgi:hypothetical protein
MSRISHEYYKGGVETRALPRLIPRNSLRLEIQPQDLICSRLRITGQRQQTAGRARAVEDPEL